MRQPASETRVVVHRFDSAIVAKGLSGLFNLPVRVSLEATGVYSLDPAVPLERVDGSKWQS